MIPQNVMPVVFLEGTDYEMGYQYGEQLAEYFPFACSDAWVRALKRGDSRHPTASSRENVLRDVKIYRALLEEHMPEQLEQIRGICDALADAGVALQETDILLVQSGVNRRLAAEEHSRLGSTSGGKDCCAWSAWGETTKNGQLICGDSCDGDFKPQVCMIAFPEEGCPYVTTAYIGELSDHFSYSFKGLFFGDSGGNGRRLADWGYGLRWPSVIQHCVRFADGAEDAERMIASWPHALPENYHLVDKSRSARVIEITADLQTVRKPGEYGEGDFLYSTNNFMANEMRCACDPQESSKYVLHGGWPGNAGVPRNLEMFHLFEAYKGSVDLEFAKMMWRFPGDSPSVLGEGGWSNMICRLSNTRVGLVLPDEGEFGEVHICTGPVGRVIHQFRRSTFPVQATHQFVRIPLQSSAEQIVDAMYNLGCDSIAASYHALSRSNLDHPNYFGLQEIQREAHTCLYEGREAYYKGLLSSSTRRLSWLSEAASQLALAQAHAGELREMIEMPPTIPDMLGLPAWQGGYSIEAEYGPGFESKTMDA